MEIITVTNAIQQLSNVCDGAISKDNVGFSAADAFLNQYGLYEFLTNDQEVKFIDRLQKYKHQLGVAKIVFSDHKLNAKKILTAQERINDKTFVTNKLVVVDGEIVKVSYKAKGNYFNILLGEIHEIDGRVFRSGAWNFTLSKRNIKPLIAFLKKYDFEFDEKLFIVSNDSFLGTAEVLESDVIFKFKIGIVDYTIVDKLKAFPKRFYEKHNNHAWRVPINMVNAEMLIAFLANDYYKIVGDADALSNKLNMLVKKQSNVLNQRHKNIKLSHSQESKIEIRGLNHTPYPYQIAGIEYLMKNRFSFLADDMGLGKTIEGLATIEQLNAYPVLITCLTIVKYNWRNEIEKWVTKELSIHIINHRDTHIPDADVYIINFSSISKQKDLLIAKDLKAVIIDESQNIKTPKSQRTLAVKEIVKSSNLDACYLLSGTAILNKPKELIPQLDILGMLDLFGGFFKFATDYCAGKYVNGYFKYDGASNLLELHNRLREYGYMRREKEDVFPELPPVQHQLLNVDISNMNMYKKAVNNLKALLTDDSIFMSTFTARLENLLLFKFKKFKTLSEFANNLDRSGLLQLDARFKLDLLNNIKKLIYPSLIDTDNGLSYLKSHSVFEFCNAQLPGMTEISILDALKKVFTKYYLIGLYRQSKIRAESRAQILVKLNALKLLVGVGKIKSAIEVIKTIIPNEKLVVAAKHKEVLKAITMEFKCSYIAGDVSAEKRQEIIDDFQTNPETNLIVIQLDSGGTGITLTASCKILDIELDWSPGKHMQLYKRVDRIGQKNPITIFRLLGLNSIDIELLKLLNKKEQILNAVNKGVESDVMFNVQTELLNYLKK